MSRKKDEAKDNPRNTKINKKAAKEGYEIVDCPTCYGSGTYGNHTCGLCGGKGKIRALK